MAASPPLTAIATWRAESTKRTRSPERTSANVVPTDDRVGPVAHADLDRTAVQASRLQIGYARSRAARSRSRSTVSTSVSRTPARISTRGVGSRVRSSTDSGAPSAANGTPSARCAATGANTSRPANVRGRHVQVVVGFGEFDRCRRATQGGGRPQQQPVVRAHQDRTRRPPVRLPAGMFRRQDRRLRPPPTAAGTALSGRGRPRRAGRRAPARRA